MNSLKAGIKVSAFILVTVLIFVPALVLFKLNMHSTRVKFLWVWFKLTLWIVRMKVVHNPINIKEKKSLYYVTNHSTYMDVIVLGAVITARFTPKKDIEGWFIFGTLTKINNPIFIERKRSAVKDEQRKIEDALINGDNIVLFAEGTTNDATEILPFKNAFFHIAESERPEMDKVRVQPISIVYTHVNGVPIDETTRDKLAWHGTMSLVPHVWELMKLKSATVELVFHDPIALSEYNSRKDLAKKCENLIRTGFEETWERIRKEK